MSRVYRYKLTIGHNGITMTPRMDENLGAILCNYQMFGWGGHELESLVAWSRKQRDGKNVVTALDITSWEAEAVDRRQKEMEGMLGFATNIGVNPDSMRRELEKLPEVVIRGNHFTITSWEAEAVERRREQMDELSSLLRDCATKPLEYPRLADATQENGVPDMAIPGDSAWQPGEDVRGKISRA